MNQQGSFLNRNLDPSGAFKILFAFFLLSLAQQLTHPQSQPSEEYRRGLLWLQQGETDRAREHFLALFDRRPAIPQLYLVLGSLLESDLRKSIGVVKTGAEMFPRDHRFPAYLGQLYLRKSDWEQSLYFLQRAHDLEPEDPEVRNLLAETLYSRGLQEFQNENAFESLRLAREALKLASREAKHHYLQGISLLGLGQLSDAIRSLKNSIHLEPDSHLPYYYLGLAHFQREEFERAVEYFLQAQKTAPEELAFVELMLGRAYTELQKLDLAVKQLGKALRLDPNLKQAHYFLALAHRQLGNESEALKALKAEIRSSPDLAEARLELADLYLDQADYQRALETLQHPGLTRHPKRLLLLRGKALLGSGQHTRSIEVLKRLVTGHPGLPEAYYLLAQAYLRLGDRDSARKHLEIYRRLEN